MVRQDLMELLGPVRMMFGRDGHVVFLNLNKKSSTTPIYNNRYQYHISSINDDTIKHTQAPIILVVVHTKE